MDYVRRQYVTSEEFTSPHFFPVASHLSPATLGELIESIPWSDDLEERHHGLASSGIRATGEPLEAPGSPVRGDDPPGRRDVRARHPSAGRIRAGRRSRLYRCRERESGRRRQRASRDGPPLDPRPGNPRGPAPASRPARRSPRAGPARPARRHLGANPLDDEVDARSSINDQVGVYSHPLLKVLVNRPGPSFISG